MCSALVQFVLRRETSGELLFVALQSEMGRRLAAKFGVPSDMSTAAVVVDDTSLLRSDAILYVFRRLRYPWRFLGFFTWVPRPVRDAAYRFIASRRQIFGTPESCVLPDAGTRARFLDS